ncbi:hypothetical protein GCM10011494_00960 [Novosphingobium endophyticum]|uniref:Uncharacterized protein n=2 Tax=Novosphingobium endophyticum TaxID=1955250 RepID=A0A916TPB5_9SPHN|nr:hypothetical protein GCM10011494_00960 [Novosphingobium endophyticum]
MVYNRAMIDQAVHQADAPDVETALREELARGDAMARTIPPILRHLIAAEDSTLFSDEILARIRGMLADLAHGLLDAAPERDGGELPACEADALTRAFLDNPALLSHLHALALEWQLTERLQLWLAVDPVVSPLLLELASSRDSAAQELATKFLAAQARWCQSQTRMKLSFRDLPGELFQTMLAPLRAHFGDGAGMAERAAKAEHEFRVSHDESASRLGLASRLVMSMGTGASAGLSVSHAGAALFLTALAQGSGQGRDAVVFSTHKAQLARLALALRIAGLGPRAAERELLALHPDFTPPPGFDSLSADQAAAILSSRHHAG